MTSSNVRAEIDTYIAQLKSAQSKLSAHVESQRNTHHQKLGNEANVRIVAINGLLDRLINIRPDDVDLSEINKITADVTDVVTSTTFYLNRHQTEPVSG